MSFEAHGARAALDHLAGGLGIKSARTRRHCPAARARTRVSSREQA